MNVDVLQTNSGKISADDLREVCFQFRVHCNDTLLNRVMEYCDIDGDGLLDYNEFVNFLNWKDKPFYHATALGSTKAHLYLNKFIAIHLNLQERNTF